MKGKEIFKKAVEKAQKNGMKVNWMDGLLEDVIEALWGVHIYKVIIFNSKFAKAFWGEERVKYERAGGAIEYTEPAWRYHLQRMVLCEEPLLYLKKFI